MVRYIDVHAQQRLKDLLETYLPACVAHDNGLLGTNFKLKLKYGARRAGAVW